MDCARKSNTMVRLLLGAMTVLSVAGCGSGHEKTYPVHGVVQWSDARPANELAGANVELQRIDEAQRRVSPHGEVQADGTFVLRSYEPADGAPAGEYRAIIRPVHSPDAEPSTARQLIDRRYHNFQTTPLQLMIEPKRNEITLTVEP
jgi:hypothetical protein